jgi:hypothetical protein
MSTGKETALSAGMCSLGTNSRSGSGPAGVAGGGGGDALGAAVGGDAPGAGVCGDAAAEPGPCAWPTRPSRATAAIDVRTIDLTLIFISYSA